MTNICKITPTLFFNGEGGDTEEIIAFYEAVFKDFEVIYKMPLPAGSAEGKTLARVRINGQELILFNAGPSFEFTEAFSLTIDCASQAEVDYYWEKLTADGGKPIECGWLQDRFGVFWQIVPTRMMTMMQDPDRQKTARVFNAMLSMQKMDIATLELAFENAS